MGNVAQTSVDAAYLARHVGLKSGLPITSTALTVNRLCGSGFQAIVSGAYEIQNREARIALVGGTESMSQAPMSVYGHNVRFGTKLGQDLAQVDTLWAALTDSHTNTPMGVTAENLAVKFGITRQQVDEFALSSQQAWARAQQGGVFKDEIAPITLKGRKGPEEFSVDEHPRIDTTLESLAKLPPVFKKDGVVTAGSSSGICDGAASLVLASEDAVREHSLKPLARIVGWATAGVEPTEMGIGPVPAIEAVLKKAGLRLQDVGLIEVNEAFGAQFLAVEKALGLDRGITNTAGGAIAMGHPLGASGARITGHLALRLAASKGAIKYALGSACIGGGQGMAVLLSSV